MKKSLTVNQAIIYKKSAKKEGKKDEKSLFSPFLSQESQI